MLCVFVVLATLGDGPRPCNQSCGEAPGCGAQLLDGRPTNADNKADARGTHAADRV